MKRNHATLERLVAIGVVVLGCLTSNYILAAIGAAYFVSQMID